MTIMDWIVKVWLCAIAAMIVMGLGGIARNTYAALTSGRGGDHPDDSER